MKKIVGRFHLIFLFATLSMPFAAKATDLLDVYQLAIKNDQQFQAATATRQAAGEAMPQAMAALFPNISLSASSLYNRITSPASINNVSSTSKYNSHGYILNATQPLINFNSWFNVAQAKASVAQANATYLAASQDLMVRTTTAYFNVLQAADNLRFTTAQKDYVTKQLAESRARFEVGTDPVNSVYNAQSSYATLVAQQISDANALVAAYQNLQTITGVPMKSLKRLTDDLPLPEPNPANMQTWQQTAEEHNLSLRALRYAVDAARQSIRANRSNHLPTVNATGTYEYNAYSSNSGIPALAQQSTQANFGFQVSVPIFEGGQVTSQTRQAEDNFALAAANMEQNHRQLLSDTYQTYSSIIAGISRIEADKAAIKAKNSALESNQAAYRAGTMTIIDVLKGIQDLYDAQRAYANDQYTYLLNTIKLKSLAGDLTNLDIMAINHWLCNGDTPDSDKIQIQQHVEQPEQVLQQVIADNAKNKAANS